MLKAGIIAVTGYAGVELARILHAHPEVEITAVTGRSSVGKKLGDVYPHLSDLDLTVNDDLYDSVDVVFSALDHAVSAEKLAPMLRDGARAVDISADFRLKDPEEYRTWYKADHPHPEYLEDAVYGLPELHRDEVSGADLVANPGCYPTAAILALAPAVSAGLIENDIIVDAKSGVSGAGRKLDSGYLYSEVNENLKAYAVDGHRHLAEMTQELASVDGMAAPKITFLPHLVPMTRGILASCYAPLRDGRGNLTRDEIVEVYEHFYDGHPFVTVVDTPPMTKQTLGNNTCAVYPTVDERTNRLIVISCLDNLVKGAAGQAVQNMNLMFGLPETEGLTQLALYP